MNGEIRQFSKLCHQIGRNLKCVGLCGEKNNFTEILRVIRDLEVGIARYKNMMTACIVRLSTFMTHIGERLNN